MDSSNNNQENLTCCTPLTEESDSLKHLKPMLIIGLFVYFGIIFLDLFYLGDFQLFEYSFLCIMLYFFIVNRCFMIFPMITILLIYNVVGIALPNLGVIVQNKFEKSSKADSIIKFIIYFFMIIFNCFLFYIGFNAYKEIFYLLKNRIQNNPNLIPSYMAGNGQYNNNNNYNGNSGYNYNANNNNNNQSKGFKAFSGKGYVVGSS